MVLEVISTAEQRRDKALLAATKHQKHVPTPFKSMKTPPSPTDIVSQVFPVTLNCVSSGSCWVEGREHAEAFKATSPAGVGGQLATDCCARGL